MGAPSRSAAIAENACLLALLGGVVWVEVAAGASGRGVATEEVIAAALDREPGLEAGLRTLIAGGPDAGIRVVRFDRPVGLALTGGEPSDRTALTSALPALAEATGIDLALAPDAANLHVYVVPRAEFPAYDQSEIAEDARHVARAFAAPDGAIERGRILVAAEVSPDERARLLPRLVARVLGLAALPAAGPPGLADDERAALAFLYRPELPLGGVLPRRHR
jgi:hypothetical protein